MTALSSFSFGSLFSPDAASWVYMVQSPSVYIYLGIGLFLLYWVLTILRTIKDITARTDSIFGQIIAVLIVGVGTPFLGLPLYLFFRPLRYTWDRMPRRESLHVQTVSCPSCMEKNPLYHQFCVTCGQHLTVVCKQCKATHQWSYEYCPECGAATGE